ncbi:MULTISPECIES: acyl-CoA synthetase [Streptomyces]|nr:acyl-CoA synthetase [Streptomyces scabiei]MBP5933741.1 acyl-CoA synthetase [Streptomyces sp. LBUM 1479]MDX2534996.1 acyl-CoA synthetase [Streptomyces scabiei]MDX2577036.1 acyl-CoA synthetase [Streptomyces scabiei]MDX2652803.1 acyl-CoA synthetase [Streptomyces scabiei]MDX2722039.1 acyl-CoA synthetase [Streptomyces scabiei]
MGRAPQSAAARDGAPQAQPPQGFWAQAAADPDRAVLVAPDGEEWTAGRLHAETNRLVHGLRAAGLERGDAFAVVLPNGVEFLAAYLAATQAGFYLVPVNHHLVGPEIAWIVSDSGAKVLIAHERFAEAARDAADGAELPASHRYAVGPAEGFRPYAELLDGQPESAPGDRTLGWVMNYTSGTTGRPRGIRRPLPGKLPEESYLGGFLGIFGIRPFDDNVHLVCSPLYHTAVLQFAGASLHIGHRLVLMDRWAPEEMLRVIDAHRCTHTHMVPTQFHRLLALPEEVRARYDVSSMRHAIHGAAPCPDHVKRAMIEWWGACVEEYYAASEGGGAFATAEDWLKKPGTVGKAWPISELAVFDDDGNRLPPGELGTVYMKMSTGGFSYHKDEGKTRKNRIGDFFTVGDLGLLDEDGYLFLRDRKIDLIISGGVNIYPAEIEAALLTHPAVADAAAFGIPHDDWGEEVKAVVEPAPGFTAGQALAEEILAHCTRRLAGYKRPKSVDFTEAMPRDPNGKLYKRRLREPYWEGRQKAV